MKYDPKVVKEYLLKHGKCCPKCGSNNIEIMRDSSLSAGLGTKHEVQCCSCGEHFREVFKMTGIEPAQDF